MNIKDFIAQLNYSLNEIEEHHPMPENQNISIRVLGKTRNEDIWFDDISLETAIDEDNNGSCANITINLNLKGA
jgi:hypothetical protein